MGIRFFCPHCQSRLNVKSSQAGGAGVCPDCGATVDVPEESVLPGLPKSSGERFYIEEENPPEGSSQLIDFDAQDTIVGDMAGEHAVGGMQAPPESFSPVFATTQDESSGIFMLDRPAPSPDFGKVDPILAAPDKVWYFRNKEIGERGPLKSKVMQQHVSSGMLRQAAWFGEKIGKTGPPPKTPFLRSNHQAMPAKAISPPKIGSSYQRT